MKDRDNFIIVTFMVTFLVLAGSITKYNLIITIIGGVIGALMGRLIIVLKNRKRNGEFLE